MRDVASVALNAANDIVSQLGFELADVEYAREDGQMCLTFYICSQDGVNIDDCEAVSHAIEDAVDAADPTDGKPYCLCVSTWGDRPLRRDSDLKRYIGKEIELKLKKAENGKKKKFMGILEAFDEATVTVVSGKDGKICAEKNNIETVRPYIGF